MLMPTTSSPSGTLPDCCHWTSSGTSRLQCGHQWAITTIISGPSLPGAMVTGLPV